MLMSLRHLERFDSNVKSKTRDNPLKFSFFSVLAQFTVPIGN